MNDGVVSFCENRIFPGATVLNYKSAPAIARAFGRQADSMAMSKRTGKSGAAANSRGAAAVLTLGPQACFWA
jgi:hypothetical protein